MTSTVEVERFGPVMSGLHHPEGLVWDADRAVVYAGGERGEIYRGRLDGTWDQIAHCGEGSFVLGLALDAAGALYVCERGHGRLLRLDTDDLTFTEISRGTAERPMTTPNFPAFAPDGRLFVSDSGAWDGADGVIYAIDTRRGTEVWSAAVPRFPNGLALSPDRRSLYVVESASSSVWRIGIEPGGSAGATERVWHEHETVPDGLAFDVDGTLYVSCYTPDSIYAVDVETSGSQRIVHDWTGQHLQAPTNLAFVGPGLGSLATANLCGWHLSVAHDWPAPGLPLERPEVGPWHG